MIGIEKVTTENEVPLGQVADPYGIDDVKTGQTVGESGHGEPTVISRRKGGLENSSKSGVGFTGPAGIAAETAGDVDEEPASVGVRSVIFHVDGIGSASWQGEVVPECFAADAVRDAVVVKKLSRLQLQTH